MKSSISSTSDLANHLGLSRWTVSRALNHQPGVKASTATWVREEAERQGFAPSILGCGLRRGRTDLVGVVAPDLEDYYLTRKVSVLLSRIEAAGLHGLFQFTQSTPQSERAALEKFSSMRCSGVISIASRLHSDDRSLHRLAKSDIPLVLIDPIADVGQLVVATDRGGALRDTVCHLVGLGHRHFAVLGISTDIAYGLQRLRGIKAACRACKLNMRDAFILLRPEDGPNSFEIGAQMVRQLLQQPEKMPTAIIALNDRMALGAIGTLTTAGLRIPDDVSVVGYDNSDFSAYTQPALTTIDPLVPTLIHRAMDLLLDPAKETRRFAVQPELIVRQSIGPAPVR